MTVDFPTKYPTSLTNTAWQASKKATDKVGKTGLGPLLTAAQTAWNNIDFGQYDAKTAGAKTATQALEYYNRAKQGKRGVVKTGLDAVVKAMKAAQKVSKNKLLSDKARTKAASMEAELNTLQGYLLHLDLEDFKRQAEQLTAAVSDSLALTDVTLRMHGGSLAIAAKATKAKDGTVTVSGLDWERTAGDPQKLVNQRLTVKAEQPDHSLWTNDMILKTLTNGNRTATFKAP